MNMKRLLSKDEKGISPVLAVLLMIAVAVAASLVTYAWVMGYLGTTTARAGRAIQIQSVAFYDGGDGVFGDGDDDETVTVYVQNVGQGSVDITSVYLDGSLMWVSSVTGTGTLPEGSTANLVVTGQDFTGSDVAIKVTCVDGTFTEASEAVE